MALVVEDGTGLANAESYASVASADTRLAALGFTSWAAMTTPEKEVALRKATNYMSDSYKVRWRGYRVTETQKLDWPRNEAVNEASPVGNYFANTIVPSDVVEVCIDLAYKISTGIELAPDIEPAQKRVKVGPIEVEYDRSGNTSTVFRAIESKIRPLLKSSGPMTSLVRT